MQRSNNIMLQIILPCLAAATVMLLIIHARGVLDKSSPTTPQTMPYTIPILGSTLSFVFDGPKFFLQASGFCQGRWPLRVNLLNDEIYLVQGSKNITSVFNNPVVTVTRAYGIVLKYCFGMDQNAVDVYVSDTSGSRHQPIPGSQTPSSRRVSYHTHENLVQGLLGSGLGPITYRMEASLLACLNKAVPNSPDWTYGEDLTTFFEEHLGTAILQTLFGPLLLSENPNFNRNLWQYDKQIMALAKRLPAWLIPGPYRLRDELIRAVMKWHQRATELSEASPENTLANESEVDAYWGSAMMRERHQMLLKIEGQDLESVASTDLGLIWASVTNVVPSTMTLCTQIYRDGSLVSDLRSALRACIRPGKIPSFDIEKIGKQPLLLSMYAETLRYGVQIHIPRCSPHQPIVMGGAIIQPQKLVFINTALAHNDEQVWNTQGGQYPLDTFWARRFLIDPTQKDSGPLKCFSSSSDQKTRTDQDQRTEKFTIEGLEGIWIPYGGGQHACPGRVVAKRIMLLTSAMMVTMFDVELLASVSALRFSSPRFGFGVRKPSKQVPFRIRRRTDLTKKGE
ncbi:conserved hypothetical protein [Talaromyces stipitatus ATCC 10500]|uniref:Cytochrome P450 n=1 Tax=Talaromyces stipitatus (strain ATCC 10500 / CBS 375.48 / QM 6759 / NRRL 1006) TaxID=441959 RepID=B8MN16_TALSN|nr:uncharacterized protein TSTA_102000 [Talaromyces stipitatus ATCC 10500]EED13965.1 conserved hypothetical protein [Talaromyces stipitatus ATCC 10500]